MYKKQWNYIIIVFVADDYLQNTPFKTGLI